MVSISEQEQQVLDSMEDELASSGAKLALMLATFARLTAGEDMPTWESIRRPVEAPSAGGGVGPRAEEPSPRRITRRLTGRIARRMLWLVVVVALMALTLVFDHGAGMGVCTVSRTAACAQVPAPIPGHPPR